MNILIVEHNPHFRKTLKSILRPRLPAARIIEEGNGRSALKRIEDHEQDIVLLDIHLPEVNGIKVAQAARKKHPECRVIVLTGYDTPEYRDAAFRAGADAFLSKREASLKEILEEVASHLKG